MILGETMFMKCKIKSHISDTKRFYVFDGKLCRVEGLILPKTKQNHQDFEKLGLKKRERFDFAPLTVFYSSPSS